MNPAAAGCGNRSMSGEPYKPYWAQAAEAPQARKNKNTAIREGLILDSFSVN